MASTDYAHFRTQMHERMLTDGGSEVERLTEEYWHTNYTGPYFDRLRDAAHPNEITEHDIVAVSMLSVEVPPRVTIWLLSRRGGHAAR